MNSRHPDKKSSRPLSLIASKEVRIACPISGIKKAALRVQSQVREDVSVVVFDGPKEWVRMKQLQSVEYDSYHAVDDYRS